VEHPDIPLEDYTHHEEETVARSSSGT
jgi:hypothetical protein